MKIIFNFDSWYWQYPLEVLCLKVMKKLSFSLFLALFVFGFISKTEAFTTYKIHNHSYSEELTDSDHRNHLTNYSNSFSFFEETKEESEDDEDTEFFSFSYTNHSFAFLENKILSARQLVFYDLLSAPIRSFNNLFIL